jgi:protein-tyrosine phosphatase
MAHGVLEAEIEAAGLQNRVEIDSAGTHDYHVGEPPDRRAQEIMRKNGYAIEQQRARQLQAEDFRTFDYILVMDEQNLRNASRLQPADATSRLHRFLEFSECYRDQEVPDPYYGGGQGFVDVLDRVRDASTGFIQHLLRERLA